jgi:hypothetical protein
MREDSTTDVHYSSPSILGISSLCCQIMYSGMTRKKFIGGRATLAYRCSMAYYCYSPPLSHPDPEVRTGHQAAPPARFPRIFTSLDNFMFPALTASHPAFVINRSHGGDRSASRKTIIECVCTILNVGLGLEDMTREC